MTEYVMIIAAWWLFLDIVICFCHFQGEICLKDSFYGSFMVYKLLFCITYDGVASSVNT